MLPAIPSSPGYGNHLLASQTAIVIEKRRNKTLYSGFSGKAPGLGVFILASLKSNQKTAHPDKSIFIAYSQKVS